MKCCCSVLLLFCVVVFVQIRLRQERDELHYPKKFHLLYDVNTTNMQQQTKTLSFSKEKVLFGSVKPIVKKNVFSLNTGFTLSAYFTVTGKPLSFHTIQIKGKKEILTSSSIMLNNQGKGYLYLKYNFHYLNPAFSIVHHAPGGLNENVDAKTEIIGRLEIQNLHYMVEQALDSPWVTL